MITRRFMVPICMLLAPLAALAADSMTHEETVVRTAYAKLAYASEQWAMTQLVSESIPDSVGVQPDNSGMTRDQRLYAARITFTLRDFVVGDVRNISNAKVSQFISPANGEVLMTNPMIYQVAEGGKFFKAKGVAPEWQTVPALPEEMPDTRISDIYSLQWHQQRPTASAWQRYASYSVTVTFQGKTHGPYKALFLFGHDADGNEMIEPEDATTNADGLALAIQGNLFPAALANTRLRRDPAVAKWLQEKQLSDASCSVGKGDVCCDLVRLQCGPGSVDLAKAIATRIAGKP
jgi:hypothetical protein